MQRQDQVRPAGKSYLAMGIYSGSAGSKGECGADVRGPERTR